MLWLPRSVQAAAHAIQETIGVQDMTTEQKRTTELVNQITEYNKLYTCRQFTTMTDYHVMMAAQEVMERRLATLRK